MLNFVDKILGGGWKLSGRITTLEADAKMMREQMEAGTALSTRVTKIETGVDGIQTEIKKLVDAVSKIADMRGDIRVIDQRVLAVEKHVDELRRGKGWIQPTPRATVDGEYP